jgi:predicted chitinase
MMIQGSHLKAIVPAITPLALDVFIPHLNEVLPRYEINTNKRIAAFIAQIAHESGSFKYCREIASGAAYEGRKDLGNTQPGDGVKFKGRGLIQITGRTNYRACSLALFKDERLLSDPDTLAKPKYAVESACWYWNTRDLNELADLGMFEKITRRINGGLNGYSERKLFYNRALKILV